jgi:hypothetical protein
VSGDDGAYFFSDFAAGKTSLDVDRAALPKRWRPARGLPRALNVPPDQPFVQRDADVPLQRAR